MPLSSKLPAGELLSNPRRIAERAAAGEEVPAKETLREARRIEKQIWSRDLIDPAPLAPSGAQRRAVQPQGLAPLSAAAACVHASAQNSFREVTRPSLRSDARLGSALLIDHRVARGARSARQSPSFDRLRLM